MVPASGVKTRQLKLNNRGAELMHLTTTLTGQDNIAGCHLPLFHKLKSVRQKAGAILIRLNFNLP